MKLNRYRVTTTIEFEPIRKDIISRGVDAQEALEKVLLRRRYANWKRPMISADDRGVQWAETVAERDNAYFAERLTAMLIED